MGVGAEAGGVVAGDLVAGGVGAKEAGGSVGRRPVARVIAKTALCGSSAFTCISFDFDAEEVMNARCITKVDVSLPQ